MDQLSDILRVALKERDISQAKAAELAEIERKTFNSYVIGRTEPDLATLKKIIKVLGIEKEIITLIMEHIVPPDESKINGNMDQIESKYVALLEKTLSEKEEDIKTYRIAVEKISSVDKDVKQLKATVDAHEGKWKDYEPIMLGLREFVIGEIASLKKQSYEKVAALLNIKVEEQQTKVEQSYIQKD